MQTEIPAFNELQSKLIFVELRSDELYVSLHRISCDAYFSWRDGEMMMTAGCTTENRAGWLAPERAYDIHTGHYCCRYPERTCRECTDIFNSALGSSEKPYIERWTEVDAAILAAIPLLFDYAEATLPKPEALKALQTQRLSDDEERAAGIPKT